MRKMLLAAAAVIVPFFGVVDLAGAKTLRQVKGPAEIPPASYQGRQYVDSRGCVFIRAGYGARVQWVPRVNRNREVYCSRRNKPSLTPSQLAALGVKVKEPVEENTTEVAKKPQKVAKKKPVAKRKPRAAVKQPTTKKIRVASGGQRQKVHPADLVRQNRAAAKTKTASAKKKRTRTVRLKDPVHGIRTTPHTIDPDVTAEGDILMRQVWTDTVPRRLVLQRVRVKLIPDPQETRTRVSSKSVEPKRKVKASGRFVQVAAFGDVGNAQRVIARFQASGLPVSSRAIRRGGQSYKVVFLGPFRSAGQAAAGLRAARKAGYSDAFYVK